MSTMHRVLIILAAFLGLVVGWLARGPVTAAPVREHAAPAQHQADGSTIVERRESTPTPPPALVEIPKGAQEVRRAHLEIQPQRGVVVHVDQPAGAVTRGDSLSLVHADLGAVDSCDCPPVTVDLSLVEMPDKTKRVVAKSSGTILSAYDLPIERPVPTVHVPRWTLSAIAVGDVEGIRPGALLSRRLGPFVVGGGLLSDPGLRRPGAIAQLGITW